MCGKYRAPEGRRNMSQAPVTSPVGEVVEFFSTGPSREEIARFRLSEEAQERLSELLRRNAAGVLTEDEEQELDQMVLLDDIVSLIRERVARASQPGAAADESAGA